MDAATVEAPTNMLLTDLLAREYAPLRMLRPKARIQYDLTLRRFAEHLGREPETSDLTGLTVQAFLAARRAKVSAGTAVKDRTHIVAIWGHAFHARYVETHPKATLPRIKAPKRVPKAYRVDEISSMIRVARALPGSWCGVPRSLWLSCFIRMAFETAERCGAIRLLEWPEVDLEERAVTFVAEHRKGAAADNRREISRELAGWLADLKRHGQQLVFPWDRNETMLWYELGKLTSICEVRGRGFHGLRRSAASYMAAAGGSAQELLTHDNARTTRLHYLDPSIAKPRQSAVDLLPQLDLGDEDAAFIPDPEPPGAAA